MATITELYGLLLIVYFLSKVQGYVRNLTIRFQSEGLPFNFRKDTFHSERATGEPSDAHNSNFLHPVLYFYKEPPTGNTTKSLISVIVNRTEFVLIDKILGNTY